MSAFSRAYFGIRSKETLLTLGMKIYSCNGYRSAPFSRAGWLVGTQLYSAKGADIVMESISLVDTISVQITSDGVPGDWPREVGVIST